MAFTSKVIFMLLASSLAWWQGYSKGSTPTTTIDDTLTSITTILNNLTTQVDGITDEASAMILGPKIAPGIDEIANAFTQGDTNLTTVSGPLADTDGDAVVQKFEMLVVALETLLKALSAKNTFTGLEDFTEQIRTALFGLISAAVDGYNFDLVSLLPNSETDGRTLNDRCSKAIDGALKAYSQLLSPECQ
ncbi:unnamed protein product [Calypogeia fissa]